MSVYHHCIQIETDPRPEFYDVTDQVKEAITQSGIEDGIVAVFSQHTTCSVIIQEDSLDETFNGTKFVFQDLLDVLEGLIPTCRKEGQYMHPGPKCVDHSVNVIKEAKAWTLNTDAHLRSALIGRSESIPLIAGKLELGEHGKVYFADFDGTHGRRRKVHVQIVGE
ncbi:MAG: secondary thiamine-phosphate synthase enzyme YjbQ [Chloroflexota bacterium]